MKGYASKVNNALAKVANLRSHVPDVSLGNDNLGDSASRLIGLSITRSSKTLVKKRLSLLGIGFGLVDTKLAMYLIVSPRMIN